MAGVGFSGGKSGRNPEKPNSDICQKSEKAAAVPLPDDPDIEGTGCLSLQIRVGVFVGDSLAGTPKPGKPPEKTGAFLLGLCFPSGAWSVLFGTTRHNEFTRIKILLKKANRTGAEALALIRHGCAVPPSPEGKALGNGL